MRALTITVLALSMLGMPGAATVSAQEPSPGLSSTGGRVEVPEAAYAVTFPEDWEVATYPMEMGTDSPDGTPIETAYISASGWAPDGRTQCSITYKPLGDPPGDPLVALEGSVDYALAHYEGARIETSSLDLPAGPAIRHRFESEWGAGASYLLSDGFDVFFLACVGKDLPDDRWLSIAESFEFLPTESPTPTPVADAAVFIDAMCTAFDELLTAVGNPDTGEGSELSRTLEDAIVRGDTALVDTTTEAMLGHLQAARSAAMRAASFPSAAAGMSEFDDFLVIVADGVVAERDAAPDGLDAAIAAANRDWARAYETWRGWITEIGPLWNEVAGDMPIPCPSPRG
jgi:hypothetical protein